MRGRNKSTRAVEMVNHHCCAFNCTNSTQKQKNVSKISGTGKCLHSLRTTQISTCMCCGNVRTRAAYAMDCSLSPGQFKCYETLQAGIRSGHFEGGPGLTKLNPVHSIFAFPQHLTLRKIYVRKQREEVKETEIPHRRRRKRCLPPEKKKTLNRN